MRFAVPLLLLGSACAHNVESSAVRVESSAAPGAVSAPVPEETVAVRVTQEPVAADVLGIVEVHGQAGTNLEQLMTEVVWRVAALGGDIARVDTFATRYETYTESYTYECGSNETHQEPRTVWQTNPDGVMTSTIEYEDVTVYVSKTCTGEREVEAGTLTIQARALRARKGAP